MNRGARASRTSRALALAVSAILLGAIAFVAPAQGSLGTFERTWGEDVANSGPGNTGVGFEICSAAAGDLCKSGGTAGAALGGELNSPRAVATDAAGNVYVADAAFSRVQKFSPSGAFERAWGEDVVSAGPGNTGVGFEICVAANGDVCKSGDIVGVAEGGELRAPVGIATDAAGNVYVADTDYNRVQKFSSAGVFERAWGNDVAMAGPGDTGDDFEICVAANGDSCQQGYFEDPALGGFMALPGDLATDAAGNVYVADSGYNRVQKFNSAGVFERAWGEDVVSAGIGNTGVGHEICVAANGAVCKIGVQTPPAFGGELSFPQGVAADAAGSVYVSDTQHNRVQKFSSAGVFERAWGEDVASAGPGNTGVGFEICVAANADTCTAGSNGGAALGGEVFFAPGLAAADGSVYIADGNFHRVQRYSSAGVFERAWGEDVVSAGPGNTGVGFEICAAANGDTCKTGIVAGAALGGEMNVPFDVGADAAGAVYLADTSHNRVQRFAADPVPLAGTPVNPPAATPPVQTATPPAQKKCRKGSKLKKGKCVKKKKREKK